MNLTEKTLEEQTVFQGKIFRVKRDKVLLPNGHQSVREVVEHPGGVMVAPLTRDDTLLFVRQYRYAFRDVILELPAGKLEPGENPYDAGLRELREEVGARAEKVVTLGCIYPTVGYCSEVIHLYCAAGLQMG
ncbi:MAG: NUDIX hydrolase [Clostridiales bacterium]|nr:NUDIX hydrolase [Clostridiales bacterium]